MPDPSVSASAFQVVSFFEAFTLLHCLEIYISELLAHMLLAFNHRETFGFEGEAKSH